MSYFGQTIFPVVPVSTASTVVNINATTTLGAGAATYGKDFIIVDPGSFTVTLPALDVTLKGQKFTILSTCATATNTINRAGSDTISYLGASATSLTIYPGTKFVFENNGTSWAVAAENPALSLTAAALDNSQRIATTAFVKNNGESFSTINQYNATTTLATSVIGSVIEFYGSTASQTLTLPVSTAGRIGDTVTIFNYATVAVTISKQGTDVVNTSSGNNATTFVMQPGDNVVLTAGNGVWFITLGTAALQFGSTLGSTPAQFDNTTRLATTAFVQKALGNAQGVAIYSSAGTISSADVGKVINTGGTSFVLNLPTGVPAGSILQFFSSSTGIVTLTATTGLIYTSNVASAATYPLIAGQSAGLAFDGTNWLVFSGGGGASKSTTGYQKLPSGIILQWGASTSSGSAAGNGAATLPIAFPTACAQAYAVVQGSSAGGYCITASLSTTAVGFTVFNSSGTITSGFTFDYFAIGY